MLFRQLILKLQTFARDTKLEEVEERLDLILGLISIQV